MELYKGTAERCRNVFKRHPKPEEGWCVEKVEKEERSGRYGGGRGREDGGEGWIGERQGGRRV